MYNVQLPPTAQSDSSGWQWLVQYLVKGAGAKPDAQPLSGDQTAAFNAGFGPVNDTFAKSLASDFEYPSFYPSNNQQLLKTTSINSLLSAAPARQQSSY